MDLMIPGVILFDGDIASRWKGIRRRLEEYSQAELWSRCSASGPLEDLPSYRITLRTWGRQIVCDAEFRINGISQRTLGCGSHPEEALRNAIDGESCPATWGEVHHRGSECCVL